MMIFPGTSKALSLLLPVFVCAQRLAGMLIKSINTMAVFFMFFRFIFFGDCCCEATFTMSKLYFNEKHFRPNGIIGNTKTEKLTGGNQLKIFYTTQFVDVSVKAYPCISDLKEMVKED